MHTAHSVYEQYNLMQNLRDHQLRVASVAKVVCESLREPVKTDLVVTGCLLHDMGNIIKFDLPYFPEFLEPQGLDYWTKEKEKWILKYGPSEHKATHDIAVELGASAELLDLMQAGGFSRLDTVARNPSYEKKFYTYADMRVGPHGVFTIDERIADGKKRYGHKKEKAINNAERQEELMQALRDLEKQIFEVSTLRPLDITNEKIAPLPQELQTYSLHL